MINSFASSLLGNNKIYSIFVLLMVAVIFFMSGIAAERAVFTSKYKEPITDNCSTKEAVDTSNSILSFD